MAVVVVVVVVVEVVAEVVVVVAGVAGVIVVVAVEVVVPGVWTTFRPARGVGLMPVVEASMAEASEVGGAVVEGGRVRCMGLHLAPSI